MKKVKAYIKVIDELDLIEGIIKLISYIPSDSEIPAVEFPLSFIEYEDEEHKFVYAADVIQKAFTALRFQHEILDEGAENAEIWRNGKIYITVYQECFGLENSYYVIFKRYFPENSMEEISST